MKKNTDNQLLGDRADTTTAGRIAERRPPGRCVPKPSPTQLLTGGVPRTESPQSPMPPLSDVPVFSHGGYDGGNEVGFDGTWNIGKFPYLIEALEEAKELAGEIQKGPEGFAVNLEGEDVLVMPTGAKVGGLLYKYRFICRGVEFLVHSKPPKGRQPVRVRYLAESLIGNNFFVVHEQFVIPFLKSLGLIVLADKPSRIDMQVMIDVPAAEFIRLFDEGHVVAKMRKGSVHFSNGLRVVKETLTLGSPSKVEVCIYDKGAQIAKMDPLKKAYFVERCVGDEWENSGRPITRVEIRLGREALKCLGVYTVADLKERAHGMLDLITHDWFRILQDPKVRGHENTAAIHPIWERVRALFSSYFSGASVKEVKWEKNQSVVCDPVALEKQALGCLSKAFAVRKGEQSSGQSVVDLTTVWADRNKKEFLEKINFHAEHVRVKIGIKLGVPSHQTGSEAEDKAEREYIQDTAKRKRESFASMFPAAVPSEPPVQQFYDPPGDTVGARWNDFMEKTKDIHLRSG